MTLEGKQVDRYTLLRLLGNGGAREVYLAKDTLTGQQVALKAIYAEPGQNPAHLFEREAAAISRLDHSRILPLNDYGIENIDNVPIIYLVMPYHPEGSLVDWLRRRSSDGKDNLTTKDIAFLIGQAADALQHAHDHSIIHRNVKPSNFLIGSTRDVPSRPDLFLFDFGMAALSGISSNQLQSVYGTAAYMAPEMWESAPVPASDQYALAVMTYELLTGTIPYQTTPGSAFYQLINEKPQPPSAINPTLSKVIDAVVLHALEKRPEDRFPSVTSFAHVLQQASQNVHSARTIQASARREEPRRLTPPVAVIEIDQAARAIPISSMRPVNTDSPVQVKPVETPAAVSSVSVSLSPSNGDVPKFKPRDWQTKVSVLPGRKKVAFAVPFGTSNRINLDKFKKLRSNVVIPAQVSTMGLQLRSRLKRKHLLIALSIILALALIGGVLAYAMSTALSSVTVKITPASSDLKSTYTILAVTKSLDTSHAQVSARMLSTVTPVQTQTAKATGSVNSPGSQATGMLTITNFDRHASITLASGTVIQDDLATGIQAMLDASVTVRPAFFTTPSIAYVAAHIVQLGKIGNVPAYDGGSQGFYHCNNGCVNNTSSWSAQNNAPFTGGTDKQKYTFVQQSDIDSVANSLEQVGAPDPQKEIQPLVRSNERLVGHPKCNPVVTSDHAVGDKVTSAVVSVSYACTGEAYDYDGMRLLAAQMLNKQANSQLGNSYAPVGSVVISLVSSVLTNAKNGTITLTVNAEGSWVYRFTNDQKQTLAKLIAGRTKSQAQSLLASQSGVARVGISSSSDTLPTDASKIVFVVNAV